MLKCVCCFGGYGIAVLRPKRGGYLNLQIFPIRHFEGPSTYVWSIHLKSVELEKTGNWIIFILNMLRQLVHPTEHVLDSVTYTSLYPTSG